MKSAKITLREGTDVTIIATGLMVNEALMAAEQLEAKGISARIVNMHTIKPIDAETVKKAAAETKGIVTAEEHSVIGGLYSAVCEVLCTEGAAVKVAPVGVMDTFGQSGPGAKLLEFYGLSAEHIVQEAEKLCR